MNIPETYYKEIEKGNIIIPQANIYPTTVDLNYCKCHISDDLDILTSVVEKTQPQYIIDAYNKCIFESCSFHPYNMFIMSWRDFDAYCSWLFNLFNEVEKKMDITFYNSIQKLVYGYMAERLFNVWLFAEKKKTICKKIIWFDDANFSDVSLIKYLLYSVKCRVINFITNLK